MSAQPLEIRMAHLEGACDQVRDRLNGIDGRLEGMGLRIDTRFDGLDRKIDMRSAQILGVVMTSWVTTILAILLHADMGSPTRLRVLAGATRDGSTSSG